MPRQACLKAFGFDSCIAATRVGIDALTHFNVPAVPLTVEVEVFNEVEVRLLREKGVWRIGIE